MSLRLDNILIRQGESTLTADFTLPAGGRFAIIGASGSGKSTLLSLIGGYLNPSAGSLLWQGRELAGTPPGKRPISALFQDHNLFPHMTVAQNVALGLRPDLRLDAAQKARVAEALAEVGLEGLGPRRPSALSGGQQSRVALARVLLRARPILLLDEPFAALGPALKAEMLALLGRIADETAATVLMVTHDPADARAFAPSTILIEDGRAHPPQPTGPLLDNPPPGLRAYLG